MTHSEFIAWLDGYLTGRDTADAALIRQKLGEVVSVAPVLPVYPFGAPNPLYPDIGRYVPAWQKGSTITCANMAPLGADFQRAIFSDTAALYEN